MRQIKNPPKIFCFLKFYTQTFKCLNFILKPSPNIYRNTSLTVHCSLFLVEMPTRPQDWSPFLYMQRAMELASTKLKENTPNNVPISWLNGFGTVEKELVEQKEAKKCHFKFPQPKSMDICSRHDIQVCRHTTFNLVPSTFNCQSCCSRN